MDSRVSDLIQKIKAAAPIARSFVGVDIGTSSIKIVQLIMKDNTVMLETYGEISSTAYGGAGPEKAAAPVLGLLSVELSDLLHEVNAQSRICGVGIPLSETFINVLDLPQRDPEQMRRIVPTEVQKFIPISVDKVMLDWYPVSEEKASVFDAVLPHKQEEAHFQKVIVVAVNTERAQRLGDVVAGSGLTPAFYEIEMFSAARACTHTVEVPALILDLGASSTKAYIINEHRIVYDARPIPVGGNDITKKIMEALSCDVPTAERTKCEQGVSAGSPASTIIAPALEPIWTYTKQMFADHQTRGGKPIERVFLLGGGSYMPGLAPLIWDKLALPVEVIRAFEHTKGPMIMENTLHEDGPRYATAIGLALRGVGK